MNQIVKIDEARRSLEHAKEPTELIEIDAKLATTGLERVGVALKHDLISVPQAIVLLNADDPIRWLYLGGGPDNA
jgi:hypothetical protein